MNAIYQFSLTTVNPIPSGGFIGIGYVSGTFTYTGGSVTTLTVTCISYCSDYAAHVIDGTTTGAGDPLLIEGLFLLIVNMWELVRM